MVSAPCFENLALIEGLTGEDYRVLFCLLSKLDFESYILVSQKDLAEKLNMKRSNVNRSVKKLIQKQILMAGPKAGRNVTYRLDPSFGWHGKEKNQDKTVRGRYEEGRRRIRGFDVIQGGKDASLVQEDSEKQ